MASEIKFNVNHRVKIKLTQYGKDYLIKKHEDFCKKFNIYTDIHIPEESEEGWSEWQLWDLMARLGNAFAGGVHLPFETNIIILTRE